MYRTLTALAVFAAVAVFAPRTGAAPPTVKLGEDLKGELTEANTLKIAHLYQGQSSDGTTGAIRQDSGYVTEFAVALKAGQSLAVTATAIGKNRNVAVFLIDPSGKAIDGTDMRSKTAQITFEEVSATGTYRLAVVSDRIGEFTVRATRPASDELDEKALEEKIKRVEKELADLKAKLEALKKKKP